MNVGTKYHLFLPEFIIAGQNLNDISYADDTFDSRTTKKSTWTNTESSKRQSEERIKQELP